VEFRGEGKLTYPFCSKRCKLIDLGKWLTEEYKISEKLEESEGAANAEPENNRISE